MTAKEFENLTMALTDRRNAIVASKRPDYTNDSVDVLANFKETAKRYGITPLQVFGVFFQKHITAIDAYIKNPDRKASEPIPDRIADAINYLELFNALAYEKEHHNDV